MKDLPERTERVKYAGRRARGAGQALGFPMTGSDRLVEYPVGRCQVSTGASASGAQGRHPGCGVSSGPRQASSLDAPGSWRVGVGSREAEDRPGTPQYLGAGSWLREITKVRRRRWRSGQ